jgi:hypothetical protein
MAVVSTRAVESVHKSSDSNSLIVKTSDSDSDSLNFKIPALTPIPS